MDEDKKLLKIGLLFLAILAMVGALWRVLSYQPNASKATAKSSISTRTAQTSQTSQTLNDLKEQELLGDTSLGERMSPRGRMLADVSRIPAYQGAEARADLQTRSSVQPPSYPGANRPFVETNFYDVDNKQSTAAGRTPSYTAAEFAANPQANFNPAQARMQEERARMLAPYLRPNAQEKSRMDAQWRKLTAGLERALAKALMPKSKQEQMVEKYTSQTGKPVAGQMPGFAGELAPVGEQLAAQKRSIVQSMGKAFGGAAAQEAAAMMDSFAGEVASALNNPSSTAEQKTQQVKEISKKYQDKMDKFAEKNQYDKFVADRVAQDNKQKEELGALYPEQKAQISQLIDQTREKDLALATQNLPREEYFNQLAQNDQQLRGDIQKVVVQGGKSVQEFRQWEEDKNKEYLQKLADLEEKGEIQSVASMASSDERQKTQEEIKVQSPKIVEGFVKSFGEESRSAVESVLTGYGQRLEQIDNEKLSPAQRQAKKVDAMNQANRELFEVGREKIESLNIPDAQKQTALEQLKQNFNIQ